MNLYSLHLHKLTSSHSPTISNHRENMIPIQEIAPFVTDK